MCEHNKLEYFGVDKKIACVDCGKQWQYTTMINYFTPINNRGETIK